MTAETNDTEPKELVQWLNAQINDLKHRGYICNGQGDRTSLKDDGKEEAYRAVLDKLGEPYEHDPENCGPCQHADEIMEDWDGTE